MERTAAPEKRLLNGLGVGTHANKLRTLGIDPVELVGQVDDGGIDVTTPDGRIELEAVATKIQETSDAEAAQIERATSLKREILEKEARGEYDKRSFWSRLKLLEKVAPKWSRKPLPDDVQQKLADVDMEPTQVVHEIRSLKDKRLTSFYFDREAHISGDSAIYTDDHVRLSDSLDSLLEIQEKLASVRLDPGQVLDQVRMERRQHSSVSLALQTAE